jgi:hypothetical protein
MSIPFYSGEIPLGVFGTLLALWQTLSNTFVNIVSFLTSYVVTGTNYAIIFVLIGGGLTTWITVTITKWVLNWF